MTSGTLRLAPAEAGHVLTLEGLLTAVEHSARYLLVYTVSENQMIIRRAC